MAQERVNLDTRNVSHSPRGHPMSNSLLKRELDHQWAVQELQQEVDRLLNENIRLMDENQTLHVLLETASHALAVYQERDAMRDPLTERWH